MLKLNTQFKLSSDNIILAQIFADEYYKSATKQRKPNALIIQTDLSVIQYKQIDFIIIRNIDSLLMKCFIKAIASV